MLRKISASDGRFKRMEFHPGLNLVIANKTTDSRDTDSRNSAGKSSLLELFHFLLGSRPGGHLAASKALKDITFSLELDWNRTYPRVSVSRSGSRADVIGVTPNIAIRQDEFLFDSPSDSATITLPQWNSLIEEQLFSLRGEHPGVSGRSLLSFYIRRVGSNAFNEAIRASHSRQSQIDATTNVSYLLGLDSELVNKYKEVAQRENARTQLQKAAKDPTLGRLVGSTADLRGQMNLARQRIEQLRTQVANFRVVPEYERLASEADTITQRLRDLANLDSIDRANAEDLRRSVEETSDTSSEYLEPAFEELSITLPDLVLRRYDEVRTFHEAVVRNRRKYLTEEIQEIEGRLHARGAERESLGTRQSEILRELNEGGALESLTVLQQALATEQSRLDTLKHRFEAAETLESSKLQIEAQRAQLRRDVSQDLSERNARIDRAIRLFSTYAQQIYGDMRDAWLSISAGQKSLQIEPHIASDGSRGIGQMKIFCFDLTLAVIAHRENRGPDFLVHDSHLFDGVDERQVARALDLARTVTESEGMQYIATLNSDVLDNARSYGLEPDEYIIRPHLTDAFDDGGLFGFRFDFSNGTSGSPKSGS
ncbi:ABC-three component system protein [Streptomyces sp. NPDC048527]|uniref:ABC-three component system protein n=1 Tax=Streptomyces sp. NPDC048527 TaxID=3365568 RepID=UPI0037146224